MLRLKLLNAIHDTSICALAMHTPLFRHTTLVGWQCRTHIYRYCRQPSNNFSYLLMLKWNRRSKLCTIPTEQHINQFVQQQKKEEENGIYARDRS